MIPPRIPFPGEQEADVAEMRREAPNPYWELRGCTLYSWPWSSLVRAKRVLWGHRVRTHRGANCEAVIVRITRDADGRETEEVES